MAKNHFRILVCLFFVQIMILPIIGTFLISPVSYLNQDSSKVEISSTVFSKVDLSVLPEIDYNTLNEQWYNPKVEMLIISPDNPEFIDSLTPLMDWKNEKGVKTIILSNFSSYPGRDNEEKIRNMIKSYYKKDRIRWVLLAGDAEDSLIPIRKVYNPDALRWGEGRTETVGGEYYKPTDFYYVDLNGSWNSDEDGNWGESSQDNSYGLDEISWDPEVYVGRFPANNADELEIMVNKTLKYEKDPNIGEWMNNMLLAGGVSSYVPQEFESRLTNYIIHNYAKTEVNYTHLADETGNLSRAILKSYFNNGFSTVLMAGHGSPTNYYRNPSAPGYTSGDAGSTTNLDMPSLVYLDACSTSSYDINDNSIGETLIKRLDAGAIGAIGGLRVTWYYEDDKNLEKLNRGNAKLFWKEFFQEKKFQQGRALYDSKVSYMNSDYFKHGFKNFDFERKNLLTYCLLGDPEVDVYTNKPKLAMNSFKENYYEGQLVSIVIKDINNKIVPYGRVHLTSLDGKYHTVYADINGVAKFRLPAQSNETYNITITGHNLIPSYFNFTTLPDETKPIIQNTQCLPGRPSTSDIISFSFNSIDNYSGTEGVFLFISKNSFDDYSFYSINNKFLENKNSFTIDTERFSPGKYAFFMVARDYANNTDLYYHNSFKFTIPDPIIDYVLPISLVVIIGISGVSLFIICRNIRKESRVKDDLI